MLEYREFCDEEEGVGFDIRVDARSREKLGFRTAQMPYNLGEPVTFVVRTSCILGVKSNIIRLITWNQKAIQQCLELDE
jgi:hypothetical protein